MCAFVAPVQAQWITQSLDLKAGWNAVYLHVDASHETLDTLVGADQANPIQEIWMWQPAPATAQFVVSPQLPTSTGSQWVSWVRTLGPTSALRQVVGNTAYLVRVSANTPTYRWNLKGKPVPFRFLWSSTGLNLLGFPTPAGAPPLFENFLTPAPSLQLAAEIYNYLGGDLSASNPARLLTLRTYPVRRGEAFWMRSGSTFNRYFGPFEIEQSNPSGIQFRDRLSQARFRLRNLTTSNLTVSMKLLASEAAPAGQVPVAGTPPMLLRGELNITNLTHGFTTLVENTQTNTFALTPAGQPGSEVEVIVGLNRSLMTAAPGGIYAGILRFTDSFSLSERDMPVSAQVASNAGLWIGSADVSQVRSYLKSFQKGANGVPVIGTNNAYVVSGVDTNMGPVARSFPLRLIVHTDNTNSYLPQRVYYGFSPATNLVNATSEALLDPRQLESARRISAVHLPFTPTNMVWKFDGEMRDGTNLTATVRLAHDEHASNPFLHTYHPDHDNLNALFTQSLASGFESYTVTRVIRLDFTPPASDFNSITLSGEAFFGVYNETVTFGAKGTDARSFDTQGLFTIHRINSVGALTTQ